MLEARDAGGSQSPQPHLKDGSVYRQNRPTKLDEIKNFHLEVQVGTLAEGNGVLIIQHGQ